MTSDKKGKIESLNSASEKLVESYDDLSIESEKHKGDKACKELKEKVDKAYESCANQQQVAREVFTQSENSTNAKTLRPLSFTAVSYTHLTLPTKRIV